MRKRVEQAAQRLVDARQARDDALAAARETGASLRDLARWSGTTHETVRTILRNRERST